MSNRPLLAATATLEDLQRLHYPLWVSPKLDGIRLRIDPTLGGVSRTYKPIPNQHIQNIIRDNIVWMKFLDGEVIIGDPVAPDVFNKTQSAVMTQTGTPSFGYYIFDHWFMPETQYALRYAHAKEVYHTFGSYLPKDATLELVPQKIATNPEAVLKFEEEYLQLGYEGIILRDGRGRYKSGRSTLKEQILLKFKRVADAEAVVVGFEALERNNNQLTRDAFGLARRSTHTAGKTPDNLLGNLVVEHPSFGKFSIGSGFDVATREEIWLNQVKYRNKTVTFKYQPIGTLDKPRFPIFKGFRHD